MPRSTKSLRATNSPNTNHSHTEDQTMTATSTATVETEEATVRELPFTLEISPAPEGFKPDRSPAGRKRIPSPFEEIVPGLKGKGWQNQPHDGKVVPENQEEIDAAKKDGSDDVPAPKYNTNSSVAQSNAKVILRELSKAVKHLNVPKWKGGEELNLGLDVNVTAENVQFNIRDKQKRRKDEDKVAPGGGDVTDGELIDDDDDSDSDSDLDNGDE